MFMLEPTPKYQFDVDIFQAFTWLVQTEITLQMNIKIPCAFIRKKKDIRKQLMAAALAA